MNRRLLCLLHVNLFHTNTATKESEKPKREKNARCARPGRAQVSSNFNYSKHFKVSPQTQHSTKPTATVELHTTAADDTDKHKRSTMAPLDASPAPSNQASPLLSSYNTLHAPQPGFQLALDSP
jgi:hypothetical protein